jgi:putative ABC transport system substrate-binding protein
MDRFRRAGTYVAKIGDAKPGGLPIKQGEQVCVGDQLKTAKELGITVPPTLLSLADEVIE